MPLTFSKTRTAPPAPTEPKRPCTGQKRYKLTLSLGKGKASHTELKWLPNNLTEEELDAIWVDWSSEFIEGGIEETV